MEFVPHRRLELVSGRSHPELANEIAKHLGVELGEANLREFANGEVHCRYASSIRGSDVFIVQTHCGPVNDTVMEQLGHDRRGQAGVGQADHRGLPVLRLLAQDRKATGREPITAKLVADMLSAAGADRVVSVDLHSGQIQGFFDVPFDHLTAAPVLEEYLRVHSDGDVVVVAPDAGRVKVAERYSQHLGSDLALVHKTRPRGSANQVEARHVVGEVEGRHCILIDDMIDTAGTIYAAAELLADAGAADIWAMATHTGPLGPGRRPAQGVDDLPGRRHRHLAGHRRPGFRQARGSVGGQDHRRCHRRRLRGHVGVGDLRRREPRLTAE